MVFVRAPQRAHGASPTQGQHVPPAARAQVIDTTFSVAEGPAGLRAALDRIAAEAEAGVAAGYSFLVLR